MARPLYPKTIEERAKVYLHCMVEIRQRLKAISAIQNADMPALFIKEACYLQLRYVCELIAIGCLVAQGDYETQRAFRDEYSPPKIFVALKKIFPHFFPQAAVIKNDQGRVHLEANCKPYAYTESKVSKLWNQSGDHLHRASITRYLKKTFSPPPETASIQKHINGVTALLECHVITIATESSENRSRLLQVTLEDDDGASVAHWMDFDGPSSSLQIQSYRAYYQG